MLMAMPFRHIMPSMDLKSLRCFIAAAEYGSIAKAAAHLRIAQPAVSRQVRKLESDLGVTLLTRTAQGVSLTEQGASLLARAAPALRALNDARDAVRHQDREPAGPVSVALMPAVGSLVAPPLVRRLRARHPKVQLELFEGLSTFIVEGLLDDRFDLGLFHADQEWPLLAVTPLLEEPMFLVGPGDGGTAPGRPLPMKRLADYPLLLPSPSNPLRRMIERLGEKNGLDLDLRESIDSTSVIKGLVGAGLGYTIQCYSYVHEDAARGELSIRPFSFAGLSRNWSLGTLADRPASTAVTAVAAILREIAADLAETHDWHPKPA